MRNTEGIAIIGAGPIVSVVRYVIEKKAETKVFMIQSGMGKEFMPENTLDMATIKTPSEPNNRRTRREKERKKKSRR